MRLQVRRKRVMGFRLLPVQRSSRTPVHMTVEDIEPLAHRDKVFIL